MTLRDAVRAAHARELRRKGDDHGLVAVGSAIGRTTRQLERSARLAEQGNLRGSEAQLARTIQQHEALIASLDLEDDLDQGVRRELHQLMSELRSLVEGIYITREF